MRIVALSDLHGELPPIPPCDLLLLGGDLCPAKNHDVIRQSAWLGGPFREWLDRVPAAAVFGVAGNHDFVFQKMPGLVPRGLRWTYLQDAAATWNGLTIYGSPWQPCFFDWAFNGTPDQLEARWRAIPDETDILLLHGPPMGHGDLSPFDDAGRKRPTHAGCRKLSARISMLPQLKLAVFGHIHAGRGVTRLGDAQLANVAVLNEDYQLAYPAMAWDVPDLAARPWPDALPETQYATAG